MVAAEAYTYAAQPQAVHSRKQPKVRGGGQTPPPLPPDPTANPSPPLPLRAFTGAPPPLRRGVAGGERRSSGADPAAAASGPPLSAVS